MKCSVVILNWNGQHHLQHFLGSVVDNTTAEAEIVVADNGSTDTSLKWLEATYPQVKTIVLDKNYGYAGGYNKALEQLNSEVFVLLNSDVETPKNWLEPLLEMMDTNADVAAVAPKILSVDEPQRFEYAGAAGGFVDILGYPFCRGRIMEQIEYDRGQYDTPSQVFWASGACMVVRAKAFREAGGFDADFFAHMEEIDLCWRMQTLGYKIMVEPRSRVYHLGGGTLPQNTPRKLYLNYRNNLAMIFKNQTTAKLLLVMPVRFCFDIASALVFMLQGHADFSKVVFKAHRDYLKSMPQLKQKRRAIVKSKAQKAYGILRNSIVVQHLVFKKQYFRQLKQLNK